MYKPVAFLLLVSLLFSSCYKVNKDAVKKPPDLIPKDSLTDIITDMEIVAGIDVYNRTHVPDYDGSTGEKYYQVLFQHYHVTKERVRASINYYNTRGDEMADIYANALGKLDEKLAETDMEKQKEEDKKHPFRVHYEHFPFLYKEIPVSNVCINPVP
jgi:hypothetical protein